MVLPYVKSSVVSYCYQKGWYNYPAKVCGGDAKLMVDALDSGDNDTIINLMEQYTLGDGYGNRRDAELANAKLIYRDSYYYNSLAAK